MLGRKYGLVTGVVVAALMGALTPVAHADFPYPSGSDPNDAAIGPEAFPPSDITGKERWEYNSRNACDQTSRGPNQRENCDPLVAANPQEQFGVTGASVDRAWEVTTGRPDVVIAVHDSGIEWQNKDDMRNLATKTWLNRGELPVPAGAAGHDANGDGIFNITDYCPNLVDGELPATCSGDSRVSDLNGTGYIDPEDLIFAFSDGSDDDGNGYVDDMVGWDSFEDDNDPYDEVGYGHGTGEAIDSTAEAENSRSEVGTCPNCMVMHMRVGDSFIADVNDFAEGVLYATDNGASLIQSALGTLNNSRFAQEAINYAYRRGVVLIASAADESAGHHNQPSALEHAVVFNSVGEPQVDAAGRPPTYLEFRGCTNYGAYITASFPSNNCSSEATGRMAGVVGLMYSAARTRLSGPGGTSNGGVSPLPSPIPGIPLPGPAPAPVDGGGTFLDYGELDGPGGVPAGHGLSAEEIDQLVVRSADDINFTEPAPYVDRTIPETQRYGATRGYDPFFGYGRVNSRRALQAIEHNVIPPEADISLPRWFELLDDSNNVEVKGYVAARRAPKFSYEVQWAVWPWHEAARGSYRTPSWNKTGVALTDPADRSTPLNGTLATISAAEIRAALTIKNTPAAATTGPAVDPATGRGEHQNRQLPDKFSVLVRVVVTAKDSVGAPIQQQVFGPIDQANGNGDPNSDEAAGTPLTGVGTKVFFFRDDPKLHAGFPKNLQGDGAASPRFIDIDDDGRDELMVATSNGLIHMYEHGGGQTPGWPVSTSNMQVHADAPAYKSNEITMPVRSAVLRTPAVGDLDRDGDLEVVAGDFMGRIWAWDKEGKVINGFPVRTDPRFSTPDRMDRLAGYYASHPEVVAALRSHNGGVNDGAVPPPDVVPDTINRHSKLNRVIRWAIAAPSLGDIDDDGELEIVIGAADRHFYAFNRNGEPVPGWPVFMRDPQYITALDPVTHEILDQSTKHLAGAKVLNNPALADLDGDNLLEVVATVNEQYEEAPNTDDPSFDSVIAALDAQGTITPGNNRVYVLHRKGERAGGAESNAQHPSEQAYRSGWPVRIATAYTELLPVVGSGPDGAPIVGNVDGAGNPEIGIFSTAGPGYILKPNGVSLYGKDPRGRDRTLLLNATGAASNSPDNPSIPAVGGAIFSDLTGAGSLQFVAPAAGLGKLLDVALPDDQLQSDNHLSAWVTAGTEQAAPRKQLPAFPREVNDLQFLATPASADVDGDGLEEILEGTAYYDFHALNALGEEPGLRTLSASGWPKFTGGWVVGPPGTGDFDEDNGRDIALTTREGNLFVWSGNGADRCAPASWPEWGHDNWSSNSFSTDAARPEVILDLKTAIPGPTHFALTWTAPGDDGECRRADSYEIRYRVATAGKLTNEDFYFSDAASTPPRPKAPGNPESYSFPRQRCDVYVAVRTWDADRDRDTPAAPANPSAVSNNVLVPGTDARCSSAPVASPSPSPSGSIPPSPKPTPSLTPSPSPSTSPTPSATPSASPSPTPSATPTPPPDTGARNLTNLEITGDLEVRVGRKTTLAAVLSSKDGRLAGETVRFIFQGATYSDQTDAQGRAEVGVTVKGPPGDYILRAEYLGSTENESSSDEAVFEAQPAGCPGFEDDPRNQVIGTRDDDELIGTPESDVICGLGGDDEVEGIGGDDLLLGNGGRDVLKGGSGRDVLKGGRGKDRLGGGSGDDRLSGGRGADKLNGGSGRDRCQGGPGRDRIGNCETGRRN